MLQPELVLIGLAAIAPALVVGAIAAFVTHPDGRTWAGALVAFVWGALVATLVASRLNDYALAQAPGVVGATLADALRGCRGRIAAGAFIGFGFAVAENVSYYLLAAVQGGYDALGRAIYLRGV